jgi:hypothetical protein
VQLLWGRLPAAWPDKAALRARFVGRLDELYDLDLAQASGLAIAAMLFAVTGEFLAKMPWLAVSGPSSISLPMI